MGADAGFQILPHSYPVVSMSDSWEFLSLYTQTEQQQQQHQNLTTIWQSAVAQQTQNDPKKEEPDFTLTIQMYTLSN